METFLMKQLVVAKIGRLSARIRFFINASALVFVAFSCWLATGPVSAAQPKNLRGPIHSLDGLDPNKCYYFDLLQRSSQALELREMPASLGWTTSGLWHSTDTGVELVLIDHTYSSLLRLVPGGFVDKGPSTPLLSAMQSDDQIPLLIEPLGIAPRTEGGYALLDLAAEGEGRIYLVDGRGKIDGIKIRDKNLAGEDGGQRVLTGVFRIIPYKEGVLAFAETEIQGKDDSARKEFLYLSKNDDSYRPYSVDLSGGSRGVADWERWFYIRDFNYMVVIGNIGYVLVQGELPSIAKIYLETAHVDYMKLSSDLGLRVSPPGVGRYNELRSQQEFISWSHAILRSFEDHRMPIGLYSFENRLFVLIKGAMDGFSGDTSWHLVEISTVDGKRLGRDIELPTSAADIVLVPGNTFSAIIEKGPIDKISGDPRPVLYRPSRGARLVPTSWIVNRHKDYAGGSCETISVGGN